MPFMEVGVRNPQDLVQPQKQAKSFFDQAHFFLANPTKHPCDTPLVDRTHLVDKGVRLHTQSALPRAQGWIKRPFARSPGDWNHAQHREALVLQYFGIGDNHAGPNSLLFVPERWIKNRQNDSTSGKLHSLAFYPALARNPADALAFTEVKEICISLGQAAHPVANPRLGQLFAFWVSLAQGATKFLLSVSLELILDCPKNEPASVALPSVDIPNDFFRNRDRHTLVHFHTLDMIILMRILSVKGDEGIGQYNYPTLVRIQRGRFDNVWAMRDSNARPLARRAQKGTLLPVSPVFRPSAVHFHFGFGV
jgi:hypothetical protein